MNLKSFRFFILVVGLALFLTSITSIVYASHSWGGYHWARTSNPFALKLGDNLSTSSNWKTFLNTTSSDWNKSSLVASTIVVGTAKRYRSPNLDCSPVSGTVQVCNKTYGNNGWLGLAQIWASNSHITQGVTKVNDTYFSTTKYNTPAWKNLVMCQEVGHTLGLDHQDEIFDNPNLGTCMDYTSDPSTNQHPNQHDFDELNTIYGHFDIFSTLAASKSKLPASASADNLDEPGAWGRAIRYSSDGNPSVLVRDLGNGNKVFTFVIWAQE